MKQFDVLDPDCKVFARRFLEASAGTGKTFTIEHLVCRFLIEGENPLPIEKVLIVTFTKAATREMKQRIYQNLVKVQKHLQTKDVDEAFPYIANILREGEEKTLSALRKIEEALFRFEEAQIFTIHGFCHRILQQHAIRAGIGFSSSEEDLMKHDVLLEEEIRKFLRSKEASQYPFFQLDRLWKDHKKDPEVFFGKVKSFLKKDLPIKDAPSFEEVFSSFQKAFLKIADRYGACLQAFLEDYEKTAACYKEMTDPSYLGQAELLGKCLEKKSIGEEEFAQLLQGDFFLRQFVEDNKKKRAKPLEDKDLHYPCLFEEMTASLLPILKEARSSSPILMKMCEDLRRIWNEKKENFDIFSHDDLIKKMMQATEKESFLQEVRAIYDAVVIDEFQDTDAQQWKIFKALFVEGEAKAIYFVGDPKQSIYSFRNADLYTYLEAEEKIGKENKAYLDTNYRSEPALVFALNALFAQEKVGNWMTLPSQGGFLPYHPVSSRKGAKDEDFEDGKGSLHFLIGKGSLGRGKSWPTPLLEEEVFFPSYVNEIIALKKKGIKASQIAFLVKDRFQASRLYLFLRRCKIKSAIKKTGHLQETPAFMAIYDVIKAIVFFEDVSLLKKVLAGPYYHYTEEELLTLEGRLYEKRAFFSELHDLHETKSLGFVFEKFFSSIGRKKKISSELVEGEDLSLYEETRQLVEILICHQSQTACNLMQLLQFLEKKKNEEAEDDLWKIRQEEDETAITIMTIHLSKGLEFDVVFALGLMMRPKRMDEPVVVRKQGQDFLQDFDMSDEASKKATFERDAEKMRQLYVALTRAKKRVYIPVAIEEKGKVPELSSASPLELFLLRFLDKQPNEESAYESLKLLTLENVVATMEALKAEAKITYSLLAEELVSTDRSSSNKQNAIFLFPEFSRSFTTKQIFSYSTLAKNTSSHPLQEAPLVVIEEGEKSMRNLLGGTKTGVIMHAILEKIFQKRLFKPFNKNKISRVVEEKLFATEREPWKDAIVSSLENLFSLSLGEEGFSLLDLDPESLEVEMEFLYPEKNQLCKGSIDLVFEKNGKYYFVDWKTNIVRKEDSLEEVMRRGDYFLQASIYRKALEKYLAIFEKRSFESCFGGCFYLFLREGKVFHFSPRPLEEYLEEPHAEH